MLAYLGLEPEMLQMDVRLVTLHSVSNKTLDQLSWQNYSVSIDPSGNVHLCPQSKIASAPIRSSSGVFATRSSLGLLQSGQSWLLDISGPSGVKYSPTPFIATYSMPPASAALTGERSSSSQLTQGLGQLKKVTSLLLQNRFCPTIVVLYD